MKKIYITLIVFFIATMPLLAQYENAPPPPNVGANTGTNGHALDGPISAPIDGGISILFLLGISYGAKKLYHLRISAKKE